MSDPVYQSPTRSCTRRHSHGIVRTAFIWTAIAVAVMVGFGLVITALGFVFHLIGLLFEAAVVTAVVAFVWRTVTHRGHYR